ncbi:MAG: ATP-binding protein [Lentisphaerales bacterium]|nr:ATP-binding protein [Lentisphaerales bacterium]
MHLKSLFSWFFSKLVFVLVLISFVLSLSKSSKEYKSELLKVESDLFRKSAEIIGSRNFNPASYVNYKITLIANDGSVISSSSFGAGASFAEVDDFQRALKGEVFTKVKHDQGVKHQILWSPTEVDGKRQVVSVDVEVDVSYAGILASNLIINLILATILGFILTRILAQPLEDTLTKSTQDINSIKDERFYVSSDDLETIETTDLSQSIIDLSKKVNEEYQRLREDVSQWKVFFSTLPRGLLAIDSERTIINCNQNSLDMISLQNSSVDESIGTTVMAAFRNADLNSITRDFFESAETIKDYEFEQVVEDIIETFKIVCVELSLQNKEDSPGALVIIENITSLRRLENMRKDFVANVSHELKTPIAIIGGFVETLKDCADDPDSTLRFLEIIEKNTARLTTVIDDLLNLSKLEQNEMLIKKDFEVRPIEETVRSAVDVCSYEASKKGINLIQNLEDSKYYKDGDMYANHRLLEQSIRNLVENAIRYSPENSDVVIVAKKQLESIEIKVTDSGPGIAEEHQTKIFERFYRVDKSRDRQTGGSGLGLAIVKHILRIHNGNISVTSEEGKGSEFTLSIPYATAP